ncbi:uncharacterized protein LOC133329815 [Musca vetustissima]|uniref:uncharacterized protein LOC133329815 n=1 Tax=Musca vetustissima TaxID=27455 RepID=UPI002AB6D8C4|nr:uncharacterized protein LOC133329815 [Musca vetustissima]
MFSSHKGLKRKTPCPGINREEFIEHLVEEYYTTTNVEAQEQVTANLANFAYDPINWEYLKKKEAIQVFLELLATSNETLKLHGIAGLCNICLDDMNLLRSQLSNMAIKRCLNSTPTAQQRQLKLVKTFTQDDLDKFSQLTGDPNPIHSTSLPAETRMVHGAFLNAVVAGLIGTHFPPGTIVLEQNFKFPKPCRINIECEFLIETRNERKISTITYECRQENNIVFQGLAKLLISNNKLTK